METEHDTDRNTLNQQSPDQKNVDPHEWVTADANDFRALSDDLAQTRLDVLLDNFSLPKYAQAMRYLEPGLAHQIQVHGDVVMVSNFILANIQATREKVAERLILAPQPLYAILADADRLAKLDLPIARRLSWLSSVHLNDTHAAIALAIGRSDVAERAALAKASHEAQKSGSDVLAPDDPNLQEQRVQEVADFVAANRGLLSWKVRENIANAGGGLRDFLADAQKMEAIDSVLATRLAGINPMFVAEIQAVIAAALRRPDAEKRSEHVAQLRRSEVRAMEQRPPQTVTMAPMATTDTAPEAEAAAPLPVLPSAPQEPPEIATPDGETVNAIRPGIPGPYSRTPAPIGNLLEQISYKPQTNGSVLYLLDGKPAFIDHGDHMEVVRAADHDDRIILAALLTAKEKYAGCFELTGTQAFQRQAIETMLKYQIKASLKNPAQELLLRQLSQALPESVKFAPASTEHPVKPVTITPEPTATIGPHIAPIKAARETPETTDSQKAPPNDEPEVRLSEGRVVRHGSARFEHKETNNMSYFVELEDANGRRQETWGIDLERAAAIANLRVGDHVVLQNHGSKAVSVQRHLFDPDGKRTGTEWIPASRVRWVIAPHPDSESKRRLRQEPESTAREQKMSAPRVHAAEPKAATRQKPPTGEPKVRRNKQRLTAP